jgi:hypothetical protein
VGIPPLDFSSKGENQMKTITSITLLSLVVVVGVSIGFAQGSKEAQSKSKASVRTITGCLSKGDSADEFNLLGTDGSTWEVRSSQVALADHVGHTIAATGVVSNPKMHNLKEDAKSAAKDTGIKKEDTEHGHLTVTDVKMVSDSCQK